MVTAAVFAAGAVAGGAVWIAGGAFGASGPARASRPAAASSPGPLIPAPGHSVHTIPSRDRQHYVPGPYISRAKADRIVTNYAHGQGPGTVTILKNTLENVAAASRSVGFWVTADTIAGSRMIWLVWLRGPEIPGCMTTSCPPVKVQLYFVALDAKTGRSDGAGWSRVGAKRLEASLHHG